MPDNRKLVKVFLASPGDLQEERKAAKIAVDEFNSTWSDQLGYYVELVGWEETVSVYGRPQEIINKELEKCELFIGAMWKRWGTPPDVSNTFTSGFEEEFERSVQAHEASGRPEIGLYFKNVSADLLNDPGEELKKVSAFRQKIELEKKIIFETFSDAREFQSRMQRCISKYIQSLINSEAQANDSKNRPSQQAASVALISAEESPFGAKGVDFLRDLLARDSHPDNETTITSADVARLRLLASIIGKHGNDEGSLGVHDANLLYIKRHELDFSEVEINGLLISGLRHIAAENSPLWHWYSSTTEDPNSLLATMTLFGPVEERIGALLAMRLLGSEIDSAPGIARNSFLVTWFSTENASTAKIAALKYLGDFGESSDLEITKSEYAKNDYQTASAAADAMLRISSRQSQDAALLTLLETQTETIDKRLLNDIFNDGPIDVKTLQQCTTHRSDAVRLIAARLLRKKKALGEENTKPLLTDNNYDVRREALHALVDIGNKFSFAQIREILIKPASYNSLLSMGAKQYPDETALDAYLAIEYRRMDAAELLALKDRDSFYERSVEFALIERQFNHLGSALVSKLEDMFQSEFDDHLKKTEEQYGVDSAISKQVSGLRDFTTKRLARWGLDIVCRTKDKAHLPIVRKLMALNLLHYSVADLEFLEQWGEWQDIPALLSSFERTGSFTLGMLNAKHDDDRYRLTAHVLYRLGREHLSDLTLLEMPEKLFAFLLFAIPDKDFRNFSTSHLMVFLHKKSDEMRKAAAIKCVLSLRKKQLSDLVGEYAHAERWRYYNAIFWLDAGLALPSKLAKTVARKAIAQGWN